MLRIPLLSRYLRPACTLPCTLSGLLVNYPRDGLRGAGKLPLKGIHSPLRPGKINQVRTLSTLLGSIDVHTLVASLDKPGVCLAFPVEGPCESGAT
jgi:hypothetical protein